MKVSKFNSLTSEILFVLSLAYLCAEVFFNVSLLHVAGDVRSSPAELDDIQFFGRAVSASGFTLLILGLFARWRFQFPDAASRVFLAVVTIFCLSPFLLMFGAGAVVAESLIWFFIPVWGVMLVVSGRGYARTPAIIGLVLLAWPAMFFGQKLLIDRYVVTPTSWQERLDARYILMLRSGLESCVIELDGLSLCDKSKDVSSQMRAVRVLISALLMHDAGRALKDLEDEREQVIESVTVWGKWFSPDKRYQAYLDLAGKQRRQYERLLKKQKERFRQEYWLPYNKASQVYDEAVSDKTVKSKINSLWLESEAEIDKGWAEYQSGVRSYRKTLLELGNKAAGFGVAAGTLYDKHCIEGGDCPRAPMDAREAVQRVGKGLNDRFTQESGYPLDLATREEFLAHPKTQAALRARVKVAYRDISGSESENIADDWRYDEAYFKADVSRLIRSRALREWQSRFGLNIPSGLDFPAFLEKSGITLPLLPENKLMSEEEFKSSWVTPTRNSAVDDALKKIRDEAPGYANGQPLEEWGRAYIRAVYIPAIALTLSLVIVLLTIGKYCVALSRPWVQRFTTLPLIMATSALWAIFILGITFAAYILPNDYTSSSAYQKYLGYARESNIFTASAIDWVNHLEPLLHRAGSWIGD